MANYDPYERDYSRRYVREEPRDDPRYLDPRDSFNSKTHIHRELVPRRREDSDLSIEEVRRDFPPPSGRDIRRARSAGPDYYEEEYEYRRGPDSRYDRDHDRRSRRGPASSYYDDDDRKHKSKGMSKQEKIIAAVAGAALLVGGKEFYDRREAKEDGGDVQRNPLSTAALAGVGALAAYQGAQYYSKQQAKKDQKANLILQRGRDGASGDYYSDEDLDPKEKKGHKNFLESAIAATGLGAAVKSLTGGGSDDQSDTRSRNGGSPSKDRNGANKIQKAAMASLLAGATEAFRVSKEPGGWKGEKTKRILTAATTAAAVDTATDDKGGKLGLAESVIGGLVGNRLIRGSRNDIEEDAKTGRSRSRSRARSRSRGGGNKGGGTGLAALAAGLGALGAKKAMGSRGRSESRSRSRSRSRRGRYDSYSPSPDRRRNRSRSRSVVDKARNSLAKLGIGAGTGAVDDRRRDQDDFSERGAPRSRRYSDDMYDDRRQGSNRDYYDDERSYRSRGDERPRRRGGPSEYASDSDLGDSSEDERRAKKMRGKQVITTGLATVATIHAAHEVYSSMEKRNARHKAVKEGRLSAAEAKKLKTKAIMQDAASVGIAALGIKGAISELKEAKHLNHEYIEFNREKARRHARRLEKRQRLTENGRRRADSWAPSSRGRGGGYSSDDEDDPRFYSRDAYGREPYGEDPYGASPYGDRPPQGGPLPAASTWSQPGH